MWGIDLVEIVLDDIYDRLDFETDDIMRGGNTMTYSKIKLYKANGIPESLSNLRRSNGSSVVEIEDAVEDASDSNDLLNRIKKLNLLRKFTLDRENDKRIRFKCTDCWGNVSYFEVIR